MCKVTFNDESYGEQTRDFHTLERDNRHNHPTFKAKSLSGGTLGVISSRDILDIEGEVEIIVKDGENYDCVKARPTQENGQWGLALKKSLRPLSGSFVTYGNIEEVREC